MSALGAQEWFLLIGFGMQIGAKHVIAPAGTLSFFKGQPDPDVTLGPPGLH